MSVLLLITAGFVSNGQKAYAQNCTVDSSICTLLISLSGFPNQVGTSDTTVELDCDWYYSEALCFAVPTPLMPLQGIGTGYITEGFMTTSTTTPPDGYIVIDHLPGQTAPASDSICRGKYQLTIPGIGTGMSDCRIIS